MVLAAANAQVPMAESIALMPQSQSVEGYTREYFADAPVMIAIAQCESRFRQFDKDGKILKNAHSSAVGVMQIMSSLHTDTAKKLGHDITTVEGNLGYARHLYEKEGTKPWNASKKCWSTTTSHLALSN